MCLVYAAAHGHKLILPLLFPNRIHLFLTTRNSISSFIAWAVKTARANHVSADVVAPTPIFKQFIKGNIKIFISAVRLLLIAHISWLNPTIIPVWPGPSTLKVTQLLRCWPFSFGLSHSSASSPLRTVMKSGSELVRMGLRTFFENAAEDLEKTFENLKLGKFTHSRSQMKGVSQNINYTTVALLPILTALFEHITQHHFGVDLLCKESLLKCLCSSPNNNRFGLFFFRSSVEDVQVSCYRILTSLYALGTGKNIYVERYFRIREGCLWKSAGVYRLSSSRGSADNCQLWVSVWPRWLEPCL